MARYRKPDVPSEISAYWWDVINRYGGDFSEWWHLRDLYALALQGIRFVSRTRGGRGFTVTAEGNIISAMSSRSEEDGDEAEDLEEGTVL